MTFDLAQALRDAVERTDEPAVPTALPGTTPVGASVGRLVARVRRRRVARNTARGVVGAGAAGTLALVGTQVVGGRGAGDLRETAASSTDGAAAACGEPVSVVTGADPGLRLARSLVTTDSPLWSGTAAQADPDDLGKLEGRTLDVYAIGFPSDAVTAPSTPATPPAAAAPFGSTTTYTVVTDPGVEGLSVVVARDGLVVGASDVATTAVADSTVLIRDMSTGATSSAVGLSVPLVSCATDGGGGALPAGDYTTYVVDPSTGAASSPYRLRLLPHDDGLTRATRLLDGEGTFFPSSGGDADEFTTDLGKTVVHVRESVTAAGARTLTYRVTQP
ncbi:hypothetical protein [Cellulomonas hominis]